MCLYEKIRSIITEATAKEVKFVFGYKNMQKNKNITEKFVVARTSVKP